jgi:histone deacetylase complex regulatory component SIN3
LAYASGVVQTMVFVCGGLTIINRGKRRVRDAEFAPPLGKVAGAATLTTVAHDGLEKAPSISEPPSTPLNVTPLNVADALAYLDEVRTELNNLDEYNKFLDILKDFKNHK